MFCTFYYILGDNISFAYGELLMLEGFLVTNLLYLGLNIFVASDYMIFQFYYSRIVSTGCEFILQIKYYKYSNQLLTNLI